MIADAVHAIEHALGRVESFTEPHPPATLRPWPFIGPVGRYDQRLLEVFVEVRPRGREADLTVFHVMLASEESLNRIGRSHRR